MTSKTKIDRAGVILCDEDREYDELSLEMDMVFDDFRKLHLSPLTQFTLEAQQWLQAYNKKYYIAQRLKRRPQILRKLRRFSVRLTQLQDIGGCRIIVDKNSDVDQLSQFITDKIRQTHFIKHIRSTDYRQLGRDDTGYRALHTVLEIEGMKLELQLRSNIQHYWSESIERTSVIYGRRLKEKDGDPVVIDYFKSFSDALHELETKQALSRAAEIDLQEKRELAEAVIRSFTGNRSLGGHVNSDIVRQMAEIEKNHTQSLSNWVLVFDWSDGNFVSWDMCSRSTDEAISTYARYEKEFPEEENYEVVMIGTSDILSVPITHSHYFGIEHHNEALEGMESSIIGLAHRSGLDVGARRILSTLKRRRFWGSNTVTLATLRNHFCRNIASFDASLDALRTLKFINGHDPISLNISKSGEINSYV